MSVDVSPVNYSDSDPPRVKTGCTLEVTCFTLKYLGKLSKIFFSKTTRPRGLIFGIWQCLGVFYKDCSNYGSWGQNWPCLGGQMVYIELYRENYKNLLLWNHKAYSFNIWHYCIDKTHWPKVHKNLYSALLMFHTQTPYIFVTKTLSWRITHLWQLLA